MTGIRERYDVVIVGGGIGGTALGAGLAEAGHDVLVLERTTEFEDRVRGEWIAPWGVAEAKRLGVYQTLLDAGGNVLTRNIGYEANLSGALGDRLALDLTGLHPESDGPLCLEHVVMQNALHDRAVSAGAEVLRGVTGVKVEAGDAPCVGLQHVGGTHSVTCRLIVGADGRASTVRRQVGIEMHEDPIDHLLAGLLIEGADEWPEDLQSTGQAGDVYYLVFPQGGGRVRLYADYSSEQKGRFTGENGAAEFLRCFDLDFVPHSKSLVGARPIGPCASFPSQDAWTETPYAQGVVLIGDAAGYNDPIIGQGLSITLRDVRTVRDLLLSSADWSPELFEPYAEERRERLRRLRLAAKYTTHFFARFGEEARARRERAKQRAEENPMYMLPLLAAFSGPDALPAEIFSEAFVESAFAP
jgi:2-polyprenyl-6-methoxyphenol hydroxylase-like FAD-dependent oxidoreductase